MFYVDNNEDVAVEADENSEELAPEELVDGSVDTKDNAEKIVDTPKTYTEEDVEELVNQRVDSLLAKKIARATSKVEREYQKKYQRAESLLKYGFNADTLEDATDKMEQFYKDKGYQVPQQQAPSLTTDQIRILAEHDADDIINDGYHEIVRETDNLANKGLENMTEQEKLTFVKLANKRAEIESAKELAEIGVQPEALQDEGYKEFSKMLNPNMSVKDKYQTYLKYKPKDKIEKIGSMKSNPTPEQKYKDFYTPEEARRFSMKDLDDPELMKRLQYSMTEWEKQRGK